MGARVDAWCPGDVDGVESLREGEVVVRAVVVRVVVVRVVIGEDGDW